MTATARRRASRPLQNTAVLVQNATPAAAWHRTRSSVRLGIGLRNEGEGSATFVGLVSLEQPSSSAGPRYQALGDDVPRGARDLPGRPPSDRASRGRTPGRGC